MSTSHGTASNGSGDLEKGTGAPVQNASHEHDTHSRMYPAFGGDLRVAPYSPPSPDSQFRKFANPGPLGLSAFALTTFVLSLINLRTRDVTQPQIVVGLAFGYGGLVQLLAGMWEMASGNTFAATALSSYGGFWISWAMIESPWSGIVSAYAGDAAALNDALGFYLMGWFIFTFILLLCTMRSTVAFFSLFFTLDLAFLFLALGHLLHTGANATANLGCQKAGGVFGLLAAFLAWYNAYAGIEDRTNSFVHVRVMHFPWSEKARLERQRSHAD